METDIKQQVVSAKIIADRLGEYTLNKPRQAILPMSSMPEFNDKIFGFNRGRIVVVAGRTAMGKSAFLTQVAWDLAKAGNKIIYLSLEMPKEELHLRCFSRNFRINNREIERGEIDKYLPQMKNFVESHVGLNLMYSDCLGATWKDIEVILKATEQKHPDAIIIDHIHHIKTGGMNDKAMLDDYLTNIHAMAKKHKITFIIGAQINRMASNENDHRPEMHYLKGTGKLEEIADLALLLHWPYYYNNTKFKTEDYEIIIAKNRFGSPGWHPCRFYPQYSLFTDKPPEIIRPRQEDDKQREAREWME